MEQEHIIDWVEKEVIKSITPQQVRMPPLCTILKSLPGIEATVANCQIVLFVCLFVLFVGVLQQRQGTTTGIEMQNYTLGNINKAIFRCGKLALVFSEHQPFFRAFVSVRPSTGSLLTVGLFRAISGKRQPQPVHQGFKGYCMSETLSVLAALAGPCFASSSSICAVT